jgi:hypothetical protein
MWNITAGSILAAETTSNSFLEMSGLENVRIYSLYIINSYKKEDVHIPVVCQAKLRVGAAAK